MKITDRIASGAEHDQTAQMSRMIMAYTGRKIKHNCMLNMRLQTIPFYI